MSLKKIMFIVLGIIGIIIVGILLFALGVGKALFDNISQENTVHIIWEAPCFTSETKIQLIHENSPSRAGVSSRDYLDIYALDTKTLKKKRIAEVDLDKEFSFAIPLKNFYFFSDNPLFEPYIQDQRHIINIVTHKEIPGFDFETFAKCLAANKQDLEAKMTTYIETARKKYLFGKIRFNIPANETTLESIRFSPFVFDQHDNKSMIFLKDRNEKDSVSLDIYSQINARYSTLHNEMLPLVPYDYIEGIGKLDPNGEITITLEIKPQDLEKLQSLLVQYVDLNGETIMDYSARVQQEFKKSEHYLLRE